MSERYACPQCLTTESLSLRTTTVISRQLFLFVENDAYLEPQVVCDPEVTVDAVSSSQLECANCNYTQTAAEWIGQLVPPSPPQE